MHIFASWPYLGVGSANFRKRAPNGDEARASRGRGQDGTGGGRQGDEEEEEEEEEEPDYFDSSGDEIPYVKRSRRR